MIKSSSYRILALIIGSSFLLSACGPTSNNKNSGNNTQFSEDETLVIPTPTPFADKLAEAKIKITNTYKKSQEFKVRYQTNNPSGEGNAEFNAKSIKEITLAGKKTPTDGKKLILVEIGIKGNAKNKGEPSTFNLIGDYPSPQFVLIDKENNKSYVETTYYSDGYTEDKKLFELSKITLDNEQWVNTAIVFEVDKSLQPDLALRFTNPQGETEFYDITD